MGRKSKSKFELKGHTLPGINQKSETANIKDGRSPSSAFQMQQPGDSPNKINWGRIGAGLATGGMSEVGRAAGNLGKKLLGGKEGDDAGGSKELLEGTGKTVEPIQGFKVSDSGGGDAETTPDPTATPDAGGGDAATTPPKPDEVLPMKSPNKKKLKTGTKTKVGGKLNEGTSPHQKL